MDLVPLEEEDIIADWWIQKLSSTQSEMREEFLRMIEKMEEENRKHPLIFSTSTMPLDNKFDVSDIYQSALDSLKEAVLAKYPR